MDNVNILVVSNIYPAPEEGRFLSLSHHLKQIQTNVFSCLQKGKDLVSHDNVGEHMAHNKFNMNIN